jgi:hypothetical protein
MAKTQARLTKRERKEKFGKGPSGTPSNTNAGGSHIHCISCGRHIDPPEFERALPSATWLTCEHGSRFAACTKCEDDARARLEEHDRTGQPPRIAAVWH